MAYQISISRGYRWGGDGSFSSISLTEWNGVIDDLKLQRKDHQEMTNPSTGEVIRISCPESALVTDDGPLLTWSGGIVNIAGPPEEAENCRTVASALGAQIYGEEGETY